MSSCFVVEFKGGKPVREIEYHNSWGGAAFIWTAVFDKYLKNPAVPYDSWLTSTMRKDTSLWDLAKRKDLADWVRIVHMATFDYAMIDRKHFAQYAADLRQFANEFYKDESVCHLHAWADDIEKSDAEAIGFHATSCSENLWQSWDEEKQESVPYDLSKGDKHFEVYDELGSRKKEA